MSAMTGRRRHTGGGSQVRSRRRRAQIWLAIAYFVHGSTLVLVLLMAAGGSIRPVGAAIVAAVLEVAPLILLLRWERRTPSAGRPAQWVRRGLVAVLSNAVAVSIAAHALTTNGGLAAPWLWAVLAAVGVLTAELTGIGVASRALRYPLTSELGEMDVEVLVKIRSERREQAAWLSSHDARVDDDALIITVRPDFTWAYASRVALVDVVEIRVSRTGSKDGPWFETDGHVCWAPPGDVVVIIHRSGTWVLPVYDAQGFADVLHARIRRVAGEPADGNERVDRRTR
jgi:hypothetical protein